MVIFTAYSTDSIILLVHTYRILIAPKKQITQNRPILRSFGDFLRQPGYLKSKIRRPVALRPFLSKSLPFKYSVITITISLYSHDLARQSLFFLFVKDLPLLLFIKKPQPILIDGKFLSRSINFFRCSPAFSMALYNSTEDRKCFWV
jgi:hypothetical protein